VSGHFAPRHVYRTECALMEVVIRIKTHNDRTWRYLVDKLGRPGEQTPRAQAPCCSWRKFQSRWAR